MSLERKLRQIPVAVRQTVGDAIPAGKLVRWWRSSHKLLRGKTPEELWVTGHHQDVLDFIKAARSGDMA